MSHVKTAISLDEELFDRLEAAAEEMRLSRSRLVGLAVEEFLERRRSDALLAQIDLAYEGEPDLAEVALLRRMARQHRQVVEGAW